MTVHGEQGRSLEVRGSKLRSHGAAFYVPLEIWSPDNREVLIVTTQRSLLSSKGFLKVVFQRTNDGTTFGYTYFVMVEREFQFRRISRRKGKRDESWWRDYATFSVKETSGLSIFDERCRSLAGPSGSQTLLMEFQGGEGVMAKR